MNLKNRHISSLSCMELHDNLKYLYAGDLNGNFFIWPLQELIKD
jgi:hypothetical protein